MIDPAGVVRGVFRQQILNIDQRATDVRGVLVGLAPTAGWALGDVLPSVHARRGTAHPTNLSSPTSSRWYLDDDEERMPEPPLPGEICDLLKAVLLYRVASRGVSAQVGGHLALRWDSLHPQRGVDPDVYLVEPAPPLGPRAKSLRTWVKGHCPPRVAVEVVSESTAEIDYLDKPARYAQAKVGELWVFDPLLLGPGVQGGPFVQQVWRRKPRGRWSRVYTGHGPAWSEELAAWLVVTDEGMRLRLADDAEGTHLWPTEAEAERAARVRAETAQVQADSARAEAEAARVLADAAWAEAEAARDDERAAKKAALAELEALRAALTRRGA